MITPAMSPVTMSFTRTIFSTLSVRNFQTSLPLHLAPFSLIHLSVRPRLNPVTHGMTHVPSHGHATDHRLADVTRTDRRQRHRRVTVPKRVTVVVSLRLTVAFNWMKKVIIPLNMTRSVPSMTVAATHWLNVVPISYSILPHLLPLISSPLPWGEV